MVLEAPNKIFLEIMLWMDLWLVVVQALGSFTVPEDVIKMHHIVIGEGQAAKYLSKVTTPLWQNCLLKRRDAAL